MNFNQQLQDAYEAGYNRALNEQPLLPEYQPSRMPIDNPKIPFRPGINPNTGRPYKKPPFPPGEPILYVPSLKEMEEWGWVEPHTWPEPGQPWYWDEDGFHTMTMA